MGSCTFLYLTHRFGFGLASCSPSHGSCTVFAHAVIELQIIVIASICMMFAYSLESAAVPFPAFVFAYFFNGYASAHLVSRWHPPESNSYDAYLVILECRH